MQNNIDKQLDQWLNGIYNEIFFGRTIWKLAEGDLKVDLILP